MRCNLACKEKGYIEKWLVLMYFCFVTIYFGFLLHITPFHLSKGSPFSYLFLFQHCNTFALNPKKCAKILMEL
jgi:hypothetical protein